MSPVSERIPLFPLGLVLFPQSYLQLHVFEQRYKDLIQHCLNNDAYFGINLADNQQLHNVGCTAKIAQVLQVYDDGRMDIVITGGRRYSLTTLHDDSISYYMGDVEYFDDKPNTRVNEPLFADCVEMYNRVIDVVFNGQGELMLQSSPAGAANLSFLMAQKAGLSLEQKQQLLELRDENERLELLHVHFKEILPKVKKAEYVQRVVMSDGYFRPDL